MTSSQRPVREAVGTYVGFVKSVKNTIQTVRKYIEYVKYLGPAGYVAMKLMQALIDLLTKWLKEQLAAVKENMQRQLALGIVRLLDTISGHDTRDEAKRTIGDALHEAHERVEEFEHQTSLEARLLPGGDLASLTKEELEPIVGPVIPAPGGGWRAVNALPPSHSEIAKDHGPDADQTFVHDRDHPTRKAVSEAVHLGKDEKPLHPDQKQTGGQHEAEEGSIFYGLARALATEADRHVLRQVEIMWAASKPGSSLYGDGGSLDTSKMEVGHDAAGKQAAQRAKQEEGRARRDGHRFAQTDAANETLMRRPEVVELMNLVDLIIAHPEDSSWWKSVFDNYINGHADEVARHIRERNAVRGSRAHIGG